MRILLSPDQPNEHDIAWLSRATISTVAWGASAWIGVTGDEVVSEGEGGGWIWIGSRELTPFFRQPLDPAGLAGGVPCIILDRSSGEATLFAHPLGRGTFFHTTEGAATYAATSILDICERTARQRPNATTVASFFVTLRNRGTCLTDTFIEGVSQLAPGERADWDGRDLRRTSYWKPLDDTENGTLDIDRAATRVRVALEGVLRRDVGLSTACLVSGGLDSSVVAGVASKLRDTRVSLLTYGHDLDTPREKRLRDDLARHLRTSIGVLPLESTAFDLDAVRRANRGANSPSGGIFSGIFARILRAARDAGYDTVLTGEGGDEVFDPSPDLLADLMRMRRWRSMLSALSFFGSYSYDISIFRLFFDHAVAPLANYAHLPLPSPAKNPFLEAVLGRDFSPALASARLQARDDKARAIADGWKLVTYYNYRQVLDLGNYEAVDLDVGDRRMRVKSPLASIEVFRAANTLRLDQQAGPWLGFRPKRLLAIAAREELPYDVAHSPKTGVGNLLWRLVGTADEDIFDSKDLSFLSSLGIRVAPRWLKPFEYPSGHALIWGLLLILCTWYRELKHAIDERSRLPYESRTVRHLR